MSRSIESDHTVRERRAEYHADISLMADVIDEAMEDDPMEEKADLMARECDQSEYHLYTGLTIEAVLYSPSQPDDWDQWVGEDPTWSEAIQAMAYSCLRQDLVEELARREEDSE